MHRLAWSVTLVALLALPALAQRNPNAGGGGGNAGGGESREAAAPRDTGGYSGGSNSGYSPSSSSSHEPSSPPSSPAQSSGGSGADSSGSRESSFSPSRSSGSGNSGGGSSTHNHGGGRSSVQPSTPSHDPGSRDFNSRSHGGQVVGVPGQPAAPGTKAQGKVTAPVMPPGSKPASTNCPSGGIRIDDACVPQCPAGGLWNGARCVAREYPCPEGQSKSGSFPCGPQPSSPAVRSCTDEEDRLRADSARLRDLQGQAANACLFDPTGAECQARESRVDRFQLEVDADWDLLDRCRHL